MHKIAKALKNLECYAAILNKSPHASIIERPAVNNYTAGDQSHAVELRSFCVKVINWLMVTAELHHSTDAPRPSNILTKSQQRLSSNTSRQVVNSPQRLRPLKLTGRRKRVNVENAEPPFCRRRCNGGQRQAALLRCVIMSEVNRVQFLVKRTIPRGVTRVYCVHYTGVRILNTIVSQLTAPWKVIPTKASSSRR
jgi:hypothetical protein